MRLFNSKRFILMKLTGKAQIEFDKWKLNRWMDSGLIQVSPVHQLLFDVSFYFYQLPFEFQFGVYVDFADSVGVHISVFTETSHSEKGVKYFQFHSYSICVENKDYCYDIDNFKTRPEARTAAIEKFNEIFNNTNLR